jgi:serine/threonine protein phosphatase 1
MRTLAIGDIHGCFTALKALVEFVPFRSDDRLIALGDYVDRGPDTAAVLDWLIEYRKHHDLIALRGNHELMMLRARESPLALECWLACGGDNALRSYSHFGDEGRLVDVPEAHWEFLEEHLEAGYETDRHLFVHANAYPDVALAEQPDVMLYWEPCEFPARHQSGKVMICGHTSQKSGHPRTWGHAVCIDTWACGRGWLTCLEPESGRYWQANQQGETRKGWLDELPA